MLKLFKLSIFILLAFNFLNAQPNLRLSPDHIEFEDVFNRLKNVYFVNDGDSILTVDSLSYNNNYYFVRFNSRQYIPLEINPGDSILMDCILDGYYYVPVADTVDTMMVYNNGESPLVKMEIKIDYYDDNYGESTIKGIVSDSTQQPVPAAQVYFFYGGTFIINSTFTDQDGNYSINLPPGNYKVCAKKDSFYVTFYGGKFDPFNAPFIKAVKDSDSIADISLAKMISTSISVSGVIYDSTSGAHISKGIIVVRKGTHTPTKKNSKSAASPGDEGIYTEFVDQDGAYTVDNIVQPTYYFVQSFSDYFVPSYFKSPDSSSVFWQNADSVFLDSHVFSVVVHMPRDSSIGGGIIEGNIGLGSAGSNPLSDVVIYAQSVDYNSAPFNYSFIQNDESYSVPFLPYGDYKIIAQKIGYENAESSIITISTNNTEIMGVDLTFNISSAEQFSLIPGEFELFQNYPNPFNPVTTIKYILPKSSEVTLRVINILGQEVVLLKKEFQFPGTYEVQLNGEHLSSGVYFVQLTAGDISRIRKIVLLK